MNKHTPLPWKRQKRSHGDVIVGPGGEVIAEVYGRSSGKPALCVANAKLMTAAPKLAEVIAMLRQAIADIRFRQWPTAGLGIDLHPDHLDALIQQADNALSLAGVAP